MSTQTTELMAKRSGGERAVPCSCIWRKQVQAPDREGRRCFEVQNKEISKLKGIGYVFIPCCRKYVVAFPVAWHLGMPPLRSPERAGATGTAFCCRAAAGSPRGLGWGSSASPHDAQVKHSASSSGFLCWSERV